MDIQRPTYLKQLADSMGNGMVKIVTGIRRCGKSHLLNVQFRDFLKREHGVEDSRIHAVSLDLKPFEALQDPNRLYEHFSKRVRRARETQYIFIDEIQLCRKTLKEGADPAKVAPEERDSLYLTFQDILNSLAAMPNADVYVTGSNSRMLSSDIATQFRGRSLEIRMRPLSFVEFLPCAQGDKHDALDEYETFGGLPQVALATDARQKRIILKSLFDKTYLRDIVERYKIKDDAALGRVADMLCSAIGSLTNPCRISNRFSSLWKDGPSEPTIRKYLDCFKDAFLFEKADRWDVKGGRYLAEPSKWYATDLGLRNARTNFRHLEPAHLMENVLYNELVARGCAVDVGVVETVEGGAGGKQHLRREIDFVVNDGSEKVYIQSAFSISDDEKMRQETASLRKTGDFFRKVVVLGGSAKPWKDEYGIEFTGIIPFLLNQESHLTAQK